MNYTTQQSKLKKVTWGKSHNHCIFESDNKSYNKTINCPSTGNVIDGGYLSLFIRPWSETECNGYTNEPGHLYNFDMESFRKYHVPTHIAELAKKGGILYCIRTDRVYGWILTDDNYNFIARQYADSRHKTMTVIDTFLPYVAIRNK